MLPTLSAFVLISVPQKTPAQVQELRTFRYGRNAEQIEAMGAEAYESFFNARTPEYDKGYMRGVALDVYVDAYRENTGRRYRSQVPRATATRLKALDKQLRFVGVLFARNDWIFSGGNAFDPESDTLEFAEAERQLYTIRVDAPDTGRMRRRLNLYQVETLQKAMKTRLYGAADQRTGNNALRSNILKINRAVNTALGLSRKPAESAVVADFVSRQALARL